MTDREKIGEAITILEGALGEWADVTATYAPQWTQLLNEVISILQSINEEVELKIPEPKPDESRLLSPEERNLAYNRAENRWETDDKKNVYEFNSLWQYISDEVAKAQRDLTTSILEPQIRAKALREVEEWLIKHNIMWQIKEFALGVPFALSEDDYWPLIESLKKGELPK